MILISNNEFKSFYIGVIKHKNDELLTYNNYNYNNNNNKNKRNNQ